MKTITIGAVICACFVMLMSCPVAIAATPNEGCNYSATARASWVANLSRALHNHDPSHAAQMIEIASAIIYGRSGVVMAQIDGGLDPNTPLKLDRYLPWTCRC